MKILIVDDDPLVARSLEVLLSAEPGLEVVGLAQDGLQALDLCERAGPEAVLMDLGMPRMDGLEATRRIKAAWPGIHVMVLTTFQDEGSLRLALGAGAGGYLLKSTPAAGIAEKLRAMAAGSAVIDTEVFRSLAETERPPMEGLSLREGEVMELVAQGCSNREIADRLCISEGTARNVLSCVLDKLGLRDRTQLAIHYWRRMP